MPASLRLPVTLPTLAVLETTPHHRFVLFAVDYEVIAAGLMPFGVRCRRNERERKASERDVTHVDLVTLGHDAFAHRGHRGSRLTAGHAAQDDRCEQHAEHRPHAEHGEHLERAPRFADLG